MYLTFDQVMVVSDKKPLTTDIIVYERNLRGERVLTPDGGVSRYASEAKPYGVLYYDANGTPCIIPDVWSQEDAAIAKGWR